MSTKSFVYSAICVCFFLVLAHSSPLENRLRGVEEPLKVMSVEQASRETVCPVRADVDVVEGRVPRRIKVLRCADENPNSWCVKNDIPDHECCEHDHNQHSMRCTQIMDYVWVRFGADNATQIQVPVGCACRITRTGRAGAVAVSTG